MGGEKVAKRRGKDKEDERGKTGAENESERGNQDRERPVGHTSGVSPLTGEDRNTIPREESVLERLGTDVPDSAASLRVRRVGRVRALGLVPVLAWGSDGLKYQNLVSDRLWE